jgi:actin-related protein
VDPTQTPILISDQNQETEDKEKVIELVFERLDSPAFFTSKRSVLSLFANGKSSGFVFSSGAEQTDLTPICDGYILKRGMSCFNQGGETITRAVLDFLESKSINKIHPYFDYEYQMNTE